MDVVLPELRFSTPTPTFNPEDVAPLLEHPIFSADRTNDLDIATTPALPGLESHRPDGTIVSDDSSLAFIERITTKSTMLLKVGDTLDDAW